MARKKVKFKVVLEKHTIVTAETSEEIAKEIQKQADYQFYQNSDSCETEVIQVTDLE